MSVADPITYSIFVVHGLRAWMSLNDVPWLPTVMMGSYSVRGGINHRLVDGPNEVGFHLEIAQEFARREGLEVTRADQWFSVAFHRASVTGEPELIAEYAIPAAWDELPEEERRFPFAGSFTFDPGGRLPRATYLDSTPVTIACEGTLELREAVRSIHAAHQARDRDRIIELCQPKVQDFAVAFPGSAEASVQAQLAQLDDVLADNPVFEPLAEEQLHFEARAGGKVVHVTRSDGLPVLIGKGTELQYRTDLLLTQTSQGWRLM